MDGPRTGRRAPADADGLARTYRDQRGHLLDIAYRMLGSLSEAEDVVQETFARLLPVPAPDDPAGWLAAVATHLCIDRLRAAGRHASYRGLWLPEPVGPGAAGGDPADQVTLDETVSMALLVVLEQLSPAERAAFVLHDVFGIPFASLAAIVGRSPAACRQLASRARRRVREQGGARFQVDEVEHRRVVDRFAQACTSGDLATLAEVLDPGVVLVTDGGGAIPAGRRPLTGAVRLVRLLRRAWELYPGSGLREASVNGEPALLAVQHGRLVAVLAFSVRDGRVQRIYAVANPAKLTRLSRALHLPAVAAERHPVPDGRSPGRRP